jgi:DNA-binding NarL/FixJ family response regulator
VTLRVLVVDDHPAILRHVSSWVEASGVASVIGTASTPAAVPGLWDELRPDITLCDVHMPEMDGFDLCRLLRDRHPTAVVVLFSARDDHTMHDSAVKAGACGLVSKTATSAELAGVLRAAATGAAAG